MLRTFCFEDAEEGANDPIAYAKWEKAVLSYYISAHPIDEFQAEMERWNCVGDIEPEQFPSECYIGGFIGGVHEVTIKKEGRNFGKKMGFVTIEGQFRAYEATMFPGVYESCLPYIVDGAPVVLKAKKGFYKESVSLEAVYIRNMVAKGIRDCPEVYIAINPSDIPSMMELASILRDHPGTTSVFITFVSEHDKITGSCGTCALNDRILNFCEEHQWHVTYKKPM
jgi:DNA polymerase III alpha subunit